MNPRLSIVIPTYARGRVLCDTLRALLVMDLERCEVIIIDQNVAHEPATRDYLASIAHRIKHVRLDPPSLARARNLGWKMAAADIVLYLDDDVIPHAGLLDGHRGSYDEPAVGGVAGRVVTIGYAASETPSPRSRWPAVGWLFFNLAQTVPCDVASARGCNMSFRRAVIEELGGFDERYTAPYRGESDFCFRMRRRGYRLVFEPKAAVDHLMHEQGGVRTTGKDESLRLQHHVDNFRFFWRNIPWWQQAATLVVFLAQEFLTRRARSARRDWRTNLRILWLFARGMWIAHRQAGSPARADAPRDVSALR